ncbi:MAG: dienelactone hydrolase family protein [Gemmatimonadaceae bacterium]|nr:dienelactone hydrolase family protein [Gloeobacterales cyanobacterium ES-bin-141]
MITNLQTRSADRQYRWHRRREFMRRLVLSGGGLLVTHLLTRASRAAVVPVDEPTIQVQRVSFAGEGGPIEAYLALPRKALPRAGVLVVQEIFGLTGYIEDVTRRLAVAGFAALAPDLYSRLGGTERALKEGGGDEARVVAQKLNDTQVNRDLDLSFAHLQNQLGPQSKIGIVGFCWGGNKSLTYAAENPDIAASVVFYGSNPEPLGRVSNLEAPVLGNYAARDERITSTLPELEAMLKKYGKAYDFKVYPNVEHAFHNDTRTDRYNAEAALDAWERTIAFFNRYLAG